MREKPVSKSSYAPNPYPQAGSELGKPFTRLDYRTLTNDIQHHIRVVSVQSRDIGYKRNIVRYGG
jgi:hypothetical protein